MKAQMALAFVLAVLIAGVAHAATATPNAPIYDMCNDPSVPWYLKLDCLWK